MTTKRNKTTARHIAARQTGFEVTFDDGSRLVFHVEDSTPAPEYQGPQGDGTLYGFDGEVHILQGIATELWGGARLIIYAETPATPYDPATQENRALYGFNSELYVKTDKGLTRRVEADRHTAAYQVIQSMTYAKATGRKGQRHGHK